MELKAQIFTALLRVLKNCFPNHEVISKKQSHAVKKTKIFFYTSAAIICCPLKKYYPRKLFYLLSPTNTPLAENRISKRSPKLYRPRPEQSKSPYIFSYFNSRLTFRIIYVLQTEHLCLFFGPVEFKWVFQFLLSGPYSNYF